MGDIDALRAVSRSLVRNRAGADCLLVHARLLNGIECATTIHALGKKDEGRMGIFGLTGQAECALPFGGSLAQRVGPALRLLREKQGQDTVALTEELSRVQQKIPRVLAWAAGLRQAARRAEEVSGHDLKRIG